MEKENIFKWVKITLILAVVFLAAQTLGTLKGLKNIDPAYNSISVSGTGEAVAVPNVASFSFSVSSDAKTASEAQIAVTEKMNSILDELKAQGIEEKDLKTTDYSIYPKYRYEAAVCGVNFCPPGRQVEDGYTVNHSVSVKVRKTEDAGKLLSLVGEKGATNLSNISFTVLDPESVTNEARDLAILDAKAKAETLAESLGVRIVRVVSFYENNGPMPYYAETMSREVAMGSDSKVPTLPQGENEVTVNVTVVYEIR